jgi:putative transposase
MPRTARNAPGGIVFHVLNRGVGRREIFAKDDDYAAFERVMAHALAFEPVKLPAYCLMPKIGTCWFVRRLRASWAA